MAVHRALREWHLPTRSGFDFFSMLMVAKDNGFDANYSIIDARLSLNVFLESYITQLGRLQPKLAAILIMKFKQQEKGRKVAYELQMSLDHVNRMQRDAIGYLAGLIYDDEIRRRKEGGPLGATRGET